MPLDQAGADPSGPTPDRVRFGRLLRKVETFADIEGWDTPTTVYVVYDATDTQTAAVFAAMAANPQLGPPTALSGYAAQPFIAGAWMEQEDVQPWQALGNFAYNLAYGDQEVHEQARTLNDFLKQPGVLGFAFVAEGHARIDTDRQTAARTVFGEFRVKELPGSVEVRMVYGRDIAGRPYQVLRRRGQPAELDLAPWQGDISTALALMCDVVKGTVPVDFRAAYPTLRQMWGGT